MGLPDRGNAVRPAHRARPGRADHACLQALRARIDLRVESLLHAADGGAVVPVIMPARGPEGRAAVEVELPRVEASRTLKATVPGINRSTDNSDVVPVDRCLGATGLAR